MFLSTSEGEKNKDNLWGITSHMFHQNKLLLFWSRACTCLPRNVSTYKAPPTYTCPFILIGWARCPSSWSSHLTLSSLLENVAQRQPPNISYLFNTQHLPLKARGQKVLQKTQGTMPRSFLVKKHLTNKKPDYGVLDSKKHGKLFSDSNWSEIC